MVDCVQVLKYPKFDLVFLFDHSQVHANKCDSALNALTMSKHLEGARQQVRDTIIMSEEGYLGKHSPAFLSSGDTQSMVFMADDCGLGYLTPDQPDLDQHNQTTGKCKVVEKRRHFSNNSTTKVQCYNRSKVSPKQNFKICLVRDNGIETHKQVDKILLGWEGKSNGLLQILWERGLLNPKLLEKYTLEGKTDPISGKSDLQYLPQNLILPNVLISRIKKLHYNY